MDYSAADIIQIITALSSFTTVLGGTYIAIKQASQGKKIDAAKVAATAVAEKLQESVNTRAQQIEDLKQVVVNKVEEVKAERKGST